MSKQPKQLSKKKQVPESSHSIRLAGKSLSYSLSRTPNVTVSSVLGPLLSPWWKWLVLAIALNALHGLAITFQNLTPKLLISDILKGNESITKAIPDIAGMPFFSDTTVSYPVSWKILMAAGLGVIYIFMSSVGRMLMWHLGYRIFLWVRERIVFVLRARFFKHVNHLCLRFHGEHPSGEIFNYLFGSPLAQFIGFYQTTANIGAGGIFAIITTLWVVGMWDGWMTMVLGLSAFLSAVVMIRSRAKVHHLHKDYQKMEGAVSATVTDLLRGSKAVKLYHMEEKVQSSFSRDAYELGSKTYYRDVLTHVEWMKHELATYISYALLIAIGAWRYTVGTVDEGMLAVYFTSFGMLTNWFTQMMTIVTQWAGAQASIERIGSVLKTSSTTPDPVGYVQEIPPKGDIIFSNVTFRYALTLEPVLKEFSLRIPYGQKIALVGPSGAGKSTVGQLLLRLYDPESGSICIDHVNLRYARGSDIRIKFGIVPQDPFVFRTTIRDNVRVASPDSTDEEIISACERANAWEFIKELPNGLDEIVGEAGSTISGGQRQRLAIARVLLANQPFLIFDEATSALDTLSEEFIQKTIEKEFKSRTVIFIAHRLATVRDCDRIIVMKDGVLMEDGSYSELMSREGLFKSLVEGQRLS